MEKVRQERFSKEIDTKEAQRMNVSREFKQKEKKRSISCDSESHLLLKTAINDYIQIYKELHDLTESIKNKRKQMYYANKRLHDQHEPSPTGNMS